MAVCLHAGCSLTTQGLRPLFTALPNRDEFRRGARTPDHPRSLFEGDAACICLWADLLGEPGRAGFPLFELDL